MSSTAELPAQSADWPRGGESLLARHWSGHRQPVGPVSFVADEPRQAAQRIADAATSPDRAQGEHIHLANAYSVALADSDPRMLQAVTGGRGWLLPDGRPIAWLSALRRDHDRLRQIRGPRLLLDVADLGRASGVKHYLLGGSEQVLEALRASLQARYPGIEIVGSASPPFRTPTADDLARRDEEISRSGAQIVWVGLGTPKQDFEAARLAASLPLLAVAVGAAFDYAAGARRPAPRWVSAVGLEWAWRLVAEPRRLWRRYTVGHAQFVRAVIRGELTRRRRHAPDR